VKLWQKKEKADEKDFNGKRTSGSGSKWHSKGDVKTNVYLIEDKTTDKGTYAIGVKLWRKIYTEAILSQRIPLFSIKFNKDGTELIVISKSDFLSVTNST